ncbi:MAG: hypothetical protein QNJ57_07160 [Flavobacteriaceae bacterium]|nr:hypothetical protein [Flavobacteriaceae bacterium]
MKTTMTLLFNFYLIALSAQATISSEDFQILENSAWEGTLTYKNYSDGKAVSIRTTMQVRIEKNKITYTVQYPDEPKENSTLIKRIRKNGSYFGNEKVLKKMRTPEGKMKVITSFEGKDNDQEATMYLIYLFNENELSITKEVQYKNSQKRFIRNSQNYKRI